MSLRVLWQDLYAIEQTSSLTAKPTFADTAIGIEGTGTAGGKFLVPLTSHPHLKPSSAVNNQELAVGKSQRDHLEYNSTIAEPASVTIEMPANAYNLSLFLWLLFQKGTSEAGTTINTLTAVPYTDADIEIYAAVTRILGGTGGADDTVSQYLPGAICKSLTLNGETGGIITLSAEMIAADWATANNDLGTVNWSDLTFSNKPPLKFQDMNFIIGSNNVSIPSFSVTISNNAQAQFYNNDTIQNFILGRVTAEGNFGVPWGDANEGGNKQLLDFKNGTQKVIQFYWGTADATTDNSVSLTFNTYSTDTDMADSNGEVVTNINFAAVEGSSDSAIKCLAGYDNTVLDRGVA